MLDVPYTHLGLALVGLAALSAATELPVRAPPDATGAARVVDGVASSPHAALGEHPVAADRIRLTPRGIGLDGPGGRAHATFRFGPVAPVAPGTDLARVLSGVPPDRAFDSPAAFAAAVERQRRAAARDPTWRPAPDRLTARRVTWDGVDVTLVG